MILCSKLPLKYFKNKLLQASEMRKKKKQTQTIYSPISLLWQGVVLYFYFLFISTLLPPISLI